MLENRAVRQHLAVERRKPEALPRTAHTLVMDWVEQHPGEARALFRRHPLAWLAYRRFPSGPVMPADPHPVMIGQFPAVHGEGLSA